MPIDAASKPSRNSLNSPPNFRAASNLNGAKVSTSQPLRTMCRTCARSMSVCGISGSRRCTWNQMPCVMWAIYSTRSDLVRGSCRDQSLGIDAGVVAACGSGWGASVWSDQGAGRSPSRRIMSSCGLPRGIFTHRRWCTRRDTKLARIWVFPPGRCGARLPWQRGWRMRGLHARRNCCCGKQPALLLCTSCAR